MKFHGILFLFFVLILGFAFAIYGGGSGSGSSSSKETLPELPSTDPVIKENRELSLKCREFASLRERVRCRILLPEKYQSNKVEFLPEECLSYGGRYRDRCIENYDKVQECWKLSSDSERIQCSRQKIGITSAKSERNLCEQKTGEGRETCLTDLKDKVFTGIKFRVYNLEEKAEKMMEKGVSEKTVIDFISLMESKKIFFNSAASIEEKKSVLENVREAWIDFIIAAKKEAGDLN